MRRLTVDARAIAIVLGALSIAAIIWLSRAAIGEWQQSATQLAEQRAEASVDLLVTVLTRNMSAVQRSLLSHDDRHESSASLDLIAGALTSYTYPEAFFRWNESSAPSPVTFYARSERPPAWLPAVDTVSSFPVTAVTEPGTGGRLLERIGRDAVLGRDYSIFDLDIGTRRYQIVAHLSYQDPFRDELESVFGFMVDLARVRERYARDLTAQVMRMGRAAGYPQLVVSETPHEEVVRAAGPGVPGQRTVPLLFFDPRLVAVDWPGDLGRDTWIVQARISDDPGFVRARQASRRTMIAVLASTVGLVVGLVLTVRAGQRSAKLTALRSEFVSTVTHELKTPIATIRAISEIFAVGHDVTPELSRKHGRLAFHEAKRLTRLIDNLLAFARVNDVTDFYVFEAVPLRTLVEQTLSDFASQLEFAEFDVQVDVPSALPPVKADRKAIGLALGNLVDNAIRYSPDERSLRIAAHVDGPFVVLEMTDKGMGIADTELPHVTKRFFRGRRSDLAGSGLGLAIVDRIVADHRGALEFRSAVGMGTTAIFKLPVATA